MRPGRIYTKLHQLKYFVIYQGLQPEQAVTAQRRHCLHPGARGCLWGGGVRTSVEVKAMLDKVVVRVTTPFDAHPISGTLNAIRDSQLSAVAADMVVVGRPLHTNTHGTVAGNRAAHGRDHDRGNVSSSLGTMMSN
jgi:hypothetical protein